MFFGIFVLNRVRVWGAAPHLPTQGYIEYPLPGFPPQSPPGIAGRAGERSRSLCGGESSRELSLWATNRRGSSLATRKTGKKTMQKCTAYRFYLWKSFFKAHTNITLFLFICVVWFTGQMKIILFIMFFINRIRCKYGCGDNEEWRNYEIDMYDDTWHYKTFSRNPPVYTIHLFQLKDRGSTVWSITKVGAIKPHTGVPNSLLWAHETNSSPNIV